MKIALLLVGYIFLGAVVAAIAKRRMEHGPYPDDSMDWPAAVGVGALWPLTMLAAAFYVSARAAYRKLYPEESNHADVS